MEPRSSGRSARVIVSGVGAVTAAGWGVDALRVALTAGRSTIAPFSRFAHETQRTHIAGQVPPQPHDSSRRARWSRLSNSDRFALFAALEAIEQSGLELPLSDRTIGVFFGSSTGGLFETETFYDDLVAGDRVPQRTLLASYQISAPAETVARHFGATGPVETISSACASGGLALEQALRSLRAFEVDIAVAGGADCLCATTYTGFNALRSVDERPCRPFRADRGGLSLGEGAGVLILEREEDAIARGAIPLAEILGAGASCDATHMTAPHPDGVWAAEAIRLALDDAGLDVDEVGYVNAHGSGTPLNDAAEYAALRLVFRDRTAQVPIEATKGVLGHLLGAAGSIEAVVATISLIGRRLHPLEGADPTDPALAVDLVRAIPRDVAGLRTALSLSLGFGGTNTAVVIGRRDY